ncbi:MAG: hypothetical protein M0032_06685 [Actinomycetota bacterium]|nr:hypothetical protein [Actinomycetota bacterium]MDA8294547.1 hypothetical protein [Actinomycetota bacterium]
MDIEQFYSADERRRRSAEVELGTEWHDARGNRYELSWVEDTGELYVMLERVPEADSWTPFGDIEVEHVPVDQLLVRVVGHVATRQELDRVLEGWQTAMPGPDSVSWVADRLRQHGVATG